MHNSHSNVINVSVALVAYYTLKEVAEFDTSRNMAKTIKIWMRTTQKETEEKEKNVKVSGTEHTVCWVIA